MRSERVWNDNREEKTGERERERERKRKRNNTCYNWPELLKREKLLRLQN